MKHSKNNLISFKSAPKPITISILFASVLLISIFTQQALAENQPITLKKALSTIVSTAVDSSERPITLRKTKEVADTYSSEPYEEAPTSAPTVQTYFPMQNGKTNNYTGLSYNATYTYTQTNFHGNNVFCENDSLDGSKAYYGYADNALLLYGFSINNAELNLNMDMAFYNPLMILTDSLLSGGPPLESSTSFSLQGENFTLECSCSITQLGTVTVPAGTYHDCVGISMELTFHAQDESDSEILKDAWVLAPDVGKLKIVLLDQYMNEHGWLELTDEAAGNDGQSPAGVPTGGGDSDGSGGGCFINIANNGYIRISQNLNHANIRLIMRFIRISNVRIGINF